MKILIAGCNKVFSIENFFVQYFKELGEDVSFVPTRTLFVNYYEKNLLNRVLYKSGVSNIWNEINLILRNQINQIKPEVLFVFKGMEIKPETLNWAKQSGIKLVNYNPDNPFIFSGRGSGNSNVSRSINYYNLHFTYDSSVQSKIVEQFGIKTSILPFGFDLDNGVYAKCLEQMEVIKTCFIGNPDHFRVKYLEELASKGIEIDVYGNDWNNMLSHPNISIFPVVYKEDYWLTLRKYRVQLNLMRPHNLDSHNMRTFEIGGVGGIQVAPKTVDHQLYYTADKEIFLYSSTDECVAQIRRLLLLSKLDADEVRLQTRERSLISDYTYKARAAQALKEIRLMNL